MKIDKEKEKFIRKVLDIVDRCRVETCKDFNGALFTMEFMELLDKYELTKK